MTLAEAAAKQITQLREESRQLQTEANELQNALEKGYYLFFPFDSDTVTYLNVGDTIFTKYGDTARVLAINAKHNTIQTELHAQLCTSRISHIVSRAQPTQ